MKRGFESRIEEAFCSVESFLTSREAESQHSGIEAVTPRVGIILGSGLGDFARRIGGLAIPYSSIKGYPVPTVQGHRGLLKLGSDVAVMAGRFHYYEGLEMDDVVLPIFVLARMGVERVVVTNAAGGINDSYTPGDLVLIKDHLNLMGRNPLTGPNLHGLGPRFPDMIRAYSGEMRECARGCPGQELKEGIYAALPGPSYETPAEIEMLARLGADMVGMSTVPEVIAANFIGLEVLGISCITNMAAGILDQPLNHSEVMETGLKASERFSHLLLHVLDRLGCKAE